MLCGGASDRHPPDATEQSDNASKKTIAATNFI